MKFGGGIKLNPCFKQKNEMGISEKKNNSKWLKFKEEDAKKNMSHI